MLSVNDTLENRRPRLSILFLTSCLYRLSAPDTIALLSVFLWFLSLFSFLFLGALIARLPCTWLDRLSRSLASQNWMYTMDVLRMSFYFFAMVADQQASCCCLTAPPYTSVTFGWETAFYDTWDELGVSYVDSR